ncbi:MAG: glycosyltransferase [Hyphomicrobium sp.]
MDRTVLEISGEASPELVSVLTPIYNAERFLPAMLDSLLGQTYRHIEVVLLDDGSTDRSLAIAHAYADRDARVRILPPHPDNRGVVATRNALVSAARGAFIGWNDSDDVSAPHRIEKQIAFLTTNTQFGAVGAGIIYADENLVRLRTEYFSADPALQRIDPQLCCATLVARRAAVEDAGPFREIFSGGGEDGDWILKMADRHDITNIADALYTYRRHASSLTHSRDNTAATTRLGVLARSAARLRRQGKPDPLNAIGVSELRDHLSPRSLIANSELTTAEIMTALGHKLEGEKPALTIGHVAPPFSSFRTLAESYAAQTLKSFEVLIAVKVDEADRFRSQIADLDVPIRVVNYATSESSPWRMLFLNSAGDYFLVAPQRRAFRPWELHGFLRTALENRPSRAIFSGRARPDIMRNGEPIAVTGALLIDGALPGLVIERTAALQLVDDANEAVPIPAKVIGVDTSGFRVKLAVLRGKWRNEGTRAVSAFVFERLIVRQLRGQGVIGAIASLAAFRVTRDRALDRLSATSRPPNLATSGASAPTARQYRVNYAESLDKATIKVAVHESWGDFDDAMHDMSESNDGIWNDVAFAPADLVQKPDFCLILNTPMEDSVEIDLPANRVWFAIGEPPTTFHRVLHEGQGSGTVVVTCDAGVTTRHEQNRRYILTPVMTRTWHVKKTASELLALASIDKPRRLSWVTSNTNILAGHQARMAFLKRLQRKVDFDLFGRGFTEIDDKWDGIAPYRYSIAFENTVAPLYFTEKLMDCFVCQTMPFYFGSPDIGKYFPERSFIRIDPDDPMIFDRIDDISSSELWRERQDDLAEARMLVLRKYNMFSQLSELLAKEAKTAAGPAMRFVIQRRVAL